MPIAYYSGPEGACKSVMMGRDCLYHHNCGGRVYAFPGFEVMDNKGKVISELLLPEEWVELLNEEELSYVVAIDEIPNFLNHHKWNSYFADLITYGAAAQRRKRSLVILATGPVFDWLPRDLKYMFHEVINMEDRHWKVKTIPRGEQAVFTREDRRGVLSGQIGRRTRPKVFYAKKYWKNINTYSIVDPRWQLNSIKFNKRKVNLDADGKVINPEIIGESDPATLDRYIKNYPQMAPTFNDQVKGRIGEIVKSLIEKGVKLFPTDEMYGLVNESLGINLSPIAIGRHIKDLGISKKEGRRPAYVLSL